jgi:hypothetical protein
MTPAIWSGICPRSIFGIRIFPIRTKPEGRDYKPGLAALGVAHSNTALRNLRLG